MCDLEAHVFSEEESVYIKKTALIEKNLVEIKNVLKDINKMREEAMTLESDMLTRMSSSTWKDVANLIGMSCTTMINDCMQILDPDNKNGDDEPKLDNSYLVERVTDI